MSADNEGRPKDEGPELWNRWIREMDEADRRAEQAYRTRRDAGLIPEPTTRAGKDWQRAEPFVEKLAETGDTPRSFIMKSLIGYAIVFAVAALALWLVWLAVRGLFGL